MSQPRSTMHQANDQALCSRMYRRAVGVHDAACQDRRRASRPAVKNCLCAEMKRLRICIWCLLVLVLLIVGCQYDATEFQGTAEAGHGLFVLNEIDAERGKTILSGLSVHHVSVVTDRNALVVRASEDELRRIAAILELIDTQEDYAVETIAALSAARNLPTNRQIAQTLGNITIGTFSDPPASSSKARAIIDIHDGSVVAVIPRHFRRELLALVELGSEGVEWARDTPESSSQVPTNGSDEATTETPSQMHVGEAAGKPLPPTAACFGTATSATASGTSSELLVPAVFEEPRPRPDAETISGGRAVTPSPPTRAPTAVIPKLEPGTSNAHLADVFISPAGQEAQAVIKPVLTEITVPSPTMAAPPHVTSDRKYQPPPLDNGDDTLVLDLPEQLDVVLLLDLAAEYLHLDCMYDPAKIRGQSVTLKLRGRFQGEIKVKELYPLLESVLKFRGFAMTRNDGNLVTIVPVDEVLAADPELIDPNNGTIRPGDVVVTRILELQHMDATSAKNLLENMSLGVAVSPVEETRTLIVTCYAYRMARIERLLQMIDRPGRPKKVRFRQLEYITASMLAEKIRAIANELQIAGVKITLASQKTARLSGGQPPFPLQEPGQTASVKPPTVETVYLDADERTNRILMVGYGEQVDTVGELVDAFDVPARELRTLQVYEIAHAEARQVKDKLQELGFTGEAAPTQKTLAPPAPAQPTPSPVGEAEQDVSPSPTGGLVERPAIVVLEATNTLLVSGTREQHAQLTGIIDYVDRPQQDSRVLKVYDLKHIEAGEAKNKLAELQICSPLAGSSQADGMPQKGASTAAANLPAVPPSPEQQAAGVPPHPGLGEPQVVVVEPTNSLLVNASPEQHARIGTVINYIDTKMLKEEIPYKLYPLKSSSPTHMAEVLQSLIQETVEQEKEGKIEKMVVNKDEKIKIVPDPNTCSLIVYATKKNQEWIANLIEQLDKRRPQVLIDVTLVEVTKSDVFNYDLNLIRSSPDLASTSGISNVKPGADSVGKFVQTGGSGLAAFYGDQQIQALLETMQSKNYGRVLAKPKLLVNDNEKGKIQTTDTTYVEVTSAIPVTSGAAGTQTNLIQTSVSFEDYKAGITLDITPHISEGELLRLDIVLTRSDFLKTAAKKPPDTRENQVDTKATLPNGSTVILGGLLKMNQSKGSSKVPIVGDIPLIGGLFRSINNEDTQSKLYVFVKAEIIRPAETLAQGMKDLEVLSERDRAAFEKHEEEFQNREQWPGIKPKPTEPARVLDAQ